jgi:hypothetical protein
MHTYMRWWAMASMAVSSASKPFVVRPAVPRSLPGGSVARRVPSRTQCAPVAGGATPDLRPGEKMLPAAQAATRLTRDASRDTGRSLGRLTGDGLLRAVEHRLHRAAESDHPAWNSRAGSSHLGYLSADPTPFSSSGVVARVLPFCAPPCLAAGSTHAASRTRWQASGATVPAADASDGSRQNPSTMDGMRGALLPLAAGFRLSAVQA